MFEYEDKKISLVFKYYKTKTRAHNSNLAKTCMVLSFGKIQFLDNVSFFVFHNNSQFINIWKINDDKYIESERE